MLVISPFLFSLTALPVNMTAFPVIADNVDLIVIYLNCSVEARMPIAYALSFGK